MIMNRDLHVFPLLKDCIYHSKLDIESIDVANQDDSTKSSAMYERRASPIKGQKTKSNIYPRKNFSWKSFKAILMKREVQYLCLESSSTHL